MRAPAALNSLPSASTAMVPFWPGRIFSSWVSLKFAVTHRSFRSTSASSGWPGCTTCPGSTDLRLTTPSDGALMVVYSRFSRACFRAASAWRARASAELARAWVTCSCCGAVCAVASPARACAAAPRAEAARCSATVMAPCAAATSDFAAAQGAITVAEQRAASARGAAAQARAGLATAQTAPQQLQVTQARANSAEARARQAEAALKQARLNLEYTTIKAPSDGVVSRKSVEPGQVVQPGQPLLALVDLNDLWVTANFKETQLEKMRPGQKATIDVDALGTEFQGHVDSIAAATGAKFSLLPPENATGNYVKVVQRIPVRIFFEPGQDPNHLLRPGMSATVTVYTR